MYTLLENISEHFAGIIFFPGTYKHNLLLQPHLDKHCEILDLSNILHLICTGNKIILLIWERLTHAVLSVDTHLDYSLGEPLLILWEHNSP